MEGAREAKVCKLMCNDKELLIHLPEAQAQVEKQEFTGKPKTLSISRH